MFATKFSALLAVLCLLALRVRHINAQEDKEYCVSWNYKDASRWASTWPQCAGQRQSPIDIELTNTRLITEPISNLMFRGYGATPVNMTMSNTGDEVQIHAYYADGETPYLAGGMLTDHYNFVQLHFHWGPTDDGGSEHTVGGHGFPLEMHMVHVKREYGDEATALKHDDGFVTVARLFNLTTNENPACEKFGDYLSEVTRPRSEIVIKPFPLTDFDFYENDDYWTYEGSLTAPDCPEVITWIIPTTLAYVAEAQLEKFKAVNLSCDNHNNRPTQPLDGRIVSFVPWDDYEGTNNYS